MASGRDQELREFIGRIAEDSARKDREVSTKVDTRMAIDGHRVREARFSGLTEA
jgi:hypothetical protein